MSDIIASTAARAQLPRLLDRVTLDHKVIHIHRTRGRPGAVLVSEERWEAMQRAAEAKSSSLQPWDYYFGESEVIPDELVPTDVDADATCLDLPRSRRSRK